MVLSEKSLGATHRDGEAMRRRISGLLTAIGLLLVIGVAPASAQSGGVVQPHRTYAGKTYGQWSAAWWQWAAGIPVSNSPIDDPTGRNCAADQSGAVWFLAGTADGSTVTRRCTLPADKAILIPIINTECSTIEGNGKTVQELRQCANTTMSGASEVWASVDGAKLRLGPCASRFRFESPPFKITFARNNAFYADASVDGTSTAVADGYWVMLRPLSPGTHTIAFHALLTDFDFEVDVRYILTVRGLG